MFSLLYANTLTIAASTSVSVRVCVCVARLLALLANALESSQVFVATLIAAAGSELLSSRAHVTEARQSPIELD